MKTTMLKEAHEIFSRLRENGVLVTQVPRIDVWLDQYYQYPQRQFLVATNNTNWDHSCLGVVGSVGSADEFASFVGHHSELGDLKKQRIYYIRDQETIRGLLEMDRMNRYFEGSAVEYIAINPIDGIRPDIYVLIQQ